MATPSYPKIVCLSNVFDENYHQLRGEKVDRSLGSKRQVLFQCLKMASGRELILLSAPPRAAERRKAKWLSPVETTYANHRQFFCANWDAPKLRIPLSWFFYTRLVFRHVRSGDLVLIDNYELIYVIAARLVSWFRKVTFILDYEDGKHLIDRGVWRMLSGFAEWWGRGLLRGALLAHPSLSKRLPESLPTELIPGFMPPQLPVRSLPENEVRLLYSGGLDAPRGIDLILDALVFLPERGWRLDITGHGPMQSLVERAVADPRWAGRVKYHGALPGEDYMKLMGECHVGLNCQKASDPISDVTFPSKVFTYLSAGLLVISSKGSCVEPVCGKACFYYEAETAQSLAAAMKEVIVNFSTVQRGLNLTEVLQRYSIEGTANRLKRFLSAVTGSS